MDDHHQISQLNHINMLEVSVNFACDNDSCTKCVEKFKMHTMAAPCYLVCKWQTLCVYICMYVCASRSKLTAPGMNHVF